MKEDAVRFTHSSRDVAAYLGLSLKTVLKLVQEGSLPAVNVSASSRPMWRFDPEDVERFLASRLANGPGLQRATPRHRPGARPGRRRSLVDEARALDEASERQNAERAGRDAARDPVRDAAALVAELGARFGVPDEEIVAILRGELERKRAEES